MQYFQKEAKGRKIYKCKLCKAITELPELHLIKVHFYTKDEIKELKNGKEPE